MSQIEERNQMTRQAHRQQALWQIILPFTVGLLVILFIVVITLLSAASGSGDISLWADISTIWLLLPVIFFTLIFFAIVSGLVYLVIRLIGVLPKYAFKTQNIMSKVQEKVRLASDKAAEPFIKVNGFWAGTRRLFGKRN
jgi:uncharacterized membrane protein YhdT